MLFMELYCEKININEDHSHRNEKRKKCISTIIINKHTKLYSKMYTKLMFKTMNSNILKLFESDILYLFIRI